MEREKAGVWGSSPFRIVGWKKVALSWGCGCFISTICWESAFFSNFPFSQVFSLVGFVAEAFSCASRWDLKKQEPFPMAQP